MVDFVLDKLRIYDTDIFKFDKYKHKYTYNGESYISVTQFISKFHKKFDTEYWSNIKSKEKGISQEEILNDWKKINDRSNEIGTATHNWIENYFNKKYTEIPNDLDIVDRINKFNIIYSTHLHELTPIKFEQRIFSLKWKIAGMIDSLFLYKGHIIIIDWKTNKILTTDNSKFGMSENLLPPFENYYKNHLTEYSIQVSLYALILSEIGINISKCYILHIGPESEAKIYNCIDFRDILLAHLTNINSLEIE